MIRQPELYRTGGKEPTYRTSFFVCQATGLTMIEYRRKVEQGVFIPKSAKSIGYITWESWAAYQRTYHVKRLSVLSYHDDEKLYKADLIRMSGFVDNKLTTMMGRGEIPSPRRDPYGAERQAFWWYAGDIKECFFGKRFCMLEDRHEPQEEPELSLAPPSPPPPIEEPPAVSAVSGSSFDEQKKLYDRIKAAGGFLAFNGGSLIAVKTPEKLRAQINAKVMAEYLQSLDYVVLTRAGYIALLCESQREVKLPF